MTFNDLSVLEKLDFQQKILKKKPYLYEKITHFLVFLEKLYSFRVYTNMNKEETLKN